MGALEVHPDAQEEALKGAFGIANFPDLISVRIEEIVTEQSPSSDKIHFLVNDPIPSEPAGIRAEHDTGEGALTNESCFTRLAVEHPNSGGNYPDCGNSGAHWVPIGICGWPGRLRMGVV